MSFFRLIKGIGASLALFILLIASTSLTFAHSATHVDTTPHIVFITSAHENSDFTQVTFPLHVGLSPRGPVYYVVTDTSNQALATRLGINYVPKLANVKGTPAVEVVKSIHGLVFFPASVNFRPVHQIVAGPTGFPPTVAQPGAVGDAGYSPLIQLSDGTVLNAPQIANLTGRADKIISVNWDKMTVTYHETHGFYDNDSVHYASFDSSSPVAAAIEDVTYAPGLNAAPSLGDESEQSSREGLIAFTNGQTGVDNPDRQGLSSALLDHKDPLNILHEIPPENNDYSPLWDVRFAQWTQQAIANHQNTRQKDFDTVLQLVQEGQVTGFQGAPFGPVGFIVTCPVISRGGGDIGE
jgi:hypothetical protein